MSEIFSWHDPNSLIPFYQDRLSIGVGEDCTQNNGACVVPLNLVPHNLLWNEAEMELPSIDEIQYYHATQSVPFEQEIRVSQILPRRCVTLPTIPLKSCNSQPLPMVLPTTTSTSPTRWPKQSFEDEQQDLDEDVPFMKLSCSKAPVLEALVG
eukprot:TRINITY_DN8297_c0_g1_i1.p1 TRINITY_DN8297_c0_g1~~TRINITY_DN8297_c0_g1_i1.p1  ORF type:complete len:153 (-),score=23.86 TRINITY_DN8297_c0_g1_i1:669-1127(-)